MENMLRLAIAMKKLWKTHKNISEIRLEMLKYVNFPMKKNENNNKTSY
jgi:hypothetical protein